MSAEIYTLLRRRWDFVNPASIFGQLDLHDRARFLEFVNGSGTRRRYSPGTTIILGIQSYPQVFYIASGTVKLTHPTRFGEAVVDIRQDDDFVGEIDVIAGGHASTRARAVSTVVAVELAPSVFLRHVQERPVVAAAVMSSLAQRLRFLQRFQQGYKGSVGQRLAQRLLDLGLAMHASGPIGAFTVPVAQRELAASIGVSTSSVENELRVLKLRDVVCGKQRRRSCVRVLRPADLVDDLFTYDIHTPESYERFVNAGSTNPVPA